MMQSVMKNTHSKVKFWLLSNYASPWAAAQNKSTHTRWGLGYAACGSWQCG